MAPLLCARVDESVLDDVAIARLKEQADRRREEDWTSDRAPAMDKGSMKQEEGSVKMVAAQEIPNEMRSM